MPASDLRYIDGMAELREARNLDLPFDPREFSPDSFGVPIRDDLFEAYLHAWDRRFGVSCRRHHSRPSARGR